MSTEHKLIILIMIDASPCPQNDYTIIQVIIDAGLFKIIINLKNLTHTGSSTILPYPARFSDHNLNLSLPIFASEIILSSMNGVIISQFKKLTAN